MEGNDPEFQQFKPRSLLALISIGDLAANKIFHHASCYKSVQYKLDKLKCDRSSTDKKKELKKTEALDHVCKLHNETQRIQSWF